jgi:hypothetical protein
MSPFQSWYIPGGVAPFLPADASRVESKPETSDGETKLHNISRNHPANRILSRMSDNCLSQPFPAPAIDSHRCLLS